MYREAQLLLLRRLRELFDLVQEKEVMLFMRGVLLQPATQRLEARPARVGQEPAQRRLACTGGSGGSGGVRWE